MSRIESLTRSRTDRSKEISLKNKEKERMKESKDKDARYTNGHLFTSITVSGMTMCFACNKSITAKEALNCPSTCAEQMKKAYSEFCSRHTKAVKLYKELFAGKSGSSSSSGG
ncbi:hypothetical protein JRQ81_009456 [Phrynocephalus forsythii]|uniref:Uncharacterized protein n=1 Tax=Phrynocephalus forsythii TaxID=171643 RepID=A0A9Q0X9Z4_9SAUR|nr:hypothetical protein JRQ81_009456 [Phrynocephalus forsythii]